MRTRGSMVEHRFSKSGVVSSILTGCTFFVTQFQTLGYITLPGDMILELLATKTRITRSFNRDTHSHQQCTPLRLAYICVPSTACAAQRLP